MKNLKNGTKIKSHDEYEYEYIFKNETFWDMGNNEMMVSDLIGYKFEILSEEDEEIDIQSIEELAINYKECVDLGNNNTIFDYHNNTRTAINELIKAVKKLDKKIKEEE